MGLSKLRKAVRKNDLQRIEALLQKGVDPNAWDEKHAYPLATAIVEGKLDAAALLLKYNAAPHKSCGDFGSIFSAAILLGHHGIAREMLSAAPALINPRDDFYTPLHRAILHGNAVAVEFIINAGGNPFALTGDGRHALFLANQKGDADVIAKLAPSFAGMPQFLVASDDAGFWNKLSDTEIAYVSMTKNCGYKVTETFNFAAKEKNLLCQSLTAEVLNRETTGFDRVSGTGIEHAFDALQDRGGLKSAKKTDFVSRKAL